jgi:lysozyme family protein
MAKFNTAMGRQLDMSALAAKNEKVRAVGNMNVNARGDVLDSHNHVVNDGNQRINRVYQKTINARAMADDITPQQTQAAPVVAAPQPQVKFEELTEDEQIFEQSDEDIKKDI